MQRVDEAREGLGRAEARGRREQAERLVAPRAAERMLGDRQQLDMGEAQLGDIGDQPLDRRDPTASRVAVAGRAATSRDAPRRSRSARRAPAAAARPAIQSSSRPAERLRRRRRPRRWPGGGSVCWRHRIGLLRQRACRPRRRCRTCSARPAPTPRHEQLPDARRDGAGAWDGAGASQALKSPTTADALGIRRPHREAHARARRRCVTTLAPERARPARNGGPR